EGGETRTNLGAGTPPYMAPEQAAGTRRDLTARCDVHALAAILYELLTGGPPYGRDSEGAMVQLVAPDVGPAPPRRLRPEVAADLEAVVLKGLEKAPQDRYANAKELADDLRRYQQGLPTVARPVGPLGQVVWWAYRSPVRSGLALLTM